MSDVSLGRFNRWIEKLFNVKGGPTVVDVEPSLSNALIVNFPPVEERYLQQWHRFGAASNTGAAAGQFAGVQIKNTPGSGVIAVIESIVACQLTAVTRSQVNLSLSINPANGSVIVSNIRLDARTIQGSNLTVSADPNMGFGTGLLVASFVNGSSVQFINFESQEMTLLPGDALKVTNVTANEAITSGFIWRERALETSELT